MGKCARAHVPHMRGAAEKGIGVLVDAEESWIQDPIDRLTMEMMEEFNKDKAIVYNTIQLYRHDRLSFLKLSHRIAQQKGFMLGVKLVRGAYMEKERARARKSVIHRPYSRTNHLLMAILMQLLTIALTIWILLPLLLPRTTNTATCVRPN